MAVADIPEKPSKPLRPRRGGFALAMAAGLVALICAAPLLAVAWLALAGGWSDYIAHIAQTRLPAYLVNTALVGLVAMAVAGIGGTLAAWTVARYSFPGRQLFEWALALPLAMPAYAAAYAWYDLTQSAGPLSFLPTVRGPFGAGLIFAFTLYPAREDASADPNVFGFGDRATASAPRRLVRRGVLRAGAG